MSARYPGQRPRPFSASELGGIDLPPDELAAGTRLARELEAAADRGTVRPSPDFADRVMAAIAAEPVPAPVLAAGSAVRRLSLVALLAAIRDALRVAVGTGFPIAARAQGIALVLVAALVVTTAGVATAGAFGLLGSQQTGPAPGVPVAASEEPTPSDTPSPSLPTPSPTPAVESSPPDATATPEPSEDASSEPVNSVEPAETPDDGGQGGSGNTGGSGGAAGSGDAGGTSTVSTQRPERPSSHEPAPTSTTEAGAYEHGSPAPGPTQQTPQPSTSTSPSPSASPEH